jgi:hypothetical protein
LIDRRLDDTRRTTISQRLKLQLIAIELINEANTLNQFLKTGALV